MLDAPGLTNRRLSEVARSAVENAERPIETREAGKTDAAVQYLTTLSTSATDMAQSTNQKPRPAARTLWA